MFAVSSLYGRPYMGGAAFRYRRLCDAFRRLAPANVGGLLDVVRRTRVSRNAAPLAPLDDAGRDRARLPRPAPFLVRKLRAGYPAPLFCIVWYVVTFAPTLPLRDHMTEYYPYIPVIGIAWLGAWGLTEAWRRGGGARNAAVALAALYICLVLPRTVRASNWNYGLTEKALRSGGGRRARATIAPGQSDSAQGCRRRRISQRRPR